DRILEICKKGGLWLHPQGTLESVLGISDKGGDKARAAAEQPGPIDKVAMWCAFTLDLTGDVKILLNLTTERIAHGIMEAQRIYPDRKFYAPVGTSERFDRLVEVTPTSTGKHRITVRRPEQFAGWWLEFDRSTPANELILHEPDH